MRNNAAPWFRSVNCVGQPGVLRGICNNCQHSLVFQYSTCVINNSRFKLVAGHSCARRPSCPVGGKYFPLDLRAGNNCQSSDIIRPNFENVQPISHYDWTR